MPSTAATAAAAAEKQRRCGATAANEDAPAADGCLNNNYNNNNQEGRIGKATEEPNKQSADAKGGFKDLLKGRIDIIQYLTANATGNSAANSTANSGRNSVNTNSPASTEEQQAVSSLVTGRNVLIADAEKSAAGAKETGATAGNAGGSVEDSGASLSVSGLIVSVANLPQCSGAATETSASAGTVSPDSDNSSKSRPANPATSSTKVSDLKPTIVVSASADNATASCSTSNSSGKPKQGNMMYARNPVNTAAGAHPSPHRETDSGAGTASSPSSGSANSPFSPDLYNNNANSARANNALQVQQHRNNGASASAAGVIQQANAVVNGPNNQPSNAPGVILGVHNMDLSGAFAAHLAPPPQHPQQAVTSSTGAVAQRPSAELMPHSQAHLLPQHVATGSDPNAGYYPVVSQNYGVGNQVNVTQANGSVQTGSGSTGLLCAPSPYMLAPGGGPQPPAHTSSAGGSGDYKPQSAAVPPTTDTAYAAVMAAAAACATGLELNGATGASQPAAAQTAQQQGRKRLRSDVNQAPSSSFAPSYGSPLDSSGDDLYGDGDGNSCYGEPRSIRFSEFQQENWHALCDVTGRELPRLGYHVIADKGFNHSAFDSAFINQKKNHFQISVIIEAVDPMPPKFVRVSRAELKPVSEFRLNFYGVKSELPTSSVAIRQSTNERKFVDYEPVRLEIQPARMTKVTVPRLHFGETTMNNQRRNGRPNPDQKYFSLVGQLDAVTMDGETYCVASHASEKVIVRASNPGQFDTGDTDVQWQRAAGGAAIYHPGPVCIGSAERPLGALTVGGDLAYTGTLYHPSDGRLKENIEEVKCRVALENVSRMRVVHYDIRPEIADQWDLPLDQRSRVGVIAQEIQQVLPDAVKDGGEFLQVDDTRIFYETAAATKELCRLTGNLEYKIDEVERISKKLSRLAKLRRQLSRSVMSEGAASSGLGSYLSASLASFTQAQGDENLLAMATLYILDWHKRNVDRPPFGPLYYTNSDYGGNSTPSRPPMDIVDWRSKGFLANLGPEWLPLNLDPGSVDGKGSNIPAPCASPLTCDGFCCPAKFTYVLNESASQADDPFFATHSDARPLGSAFEKGSTGVDKGFANDMDKTRQISDVNSLDQLTTLDLGPLPISLPDHNTTIDGKYCWGRSCDTSRANYTFYVPISRHFPPLPVEVQFHAPDQRYVRLCSTELLDRCPLPADEKKGKARQNDAPEFDPNQGPFYDSNGLGARSLEEAHTNVFDLPVGKHARAVFRFRVGYSPEMCGAQHDALVGAAFEQYTLIFYRVCDA